MRVRTSKAKGFTLIEVTLAIVIGIIMIAGATLIYNQAKTSAGNSRAQAKVVALQALVEEYAAQNQGIYPNSMNDVNALWKRKRPDDWNKSPWGGVIGNSYNPTATVGDSAAYGVNNNAGNVLAFTNTNWAASMPCGAACSGVTAGTAAPPTQTIGAVASSMIGNVNLVGGLFYDFDNNNQSYVYPIDIMTNQTALIKGYTCYVVDQQGRYPNFIVGGRANQ